MSALSCWKEGERKGGKLPPQGCWSPGTPPGGLPLRRFTYGGGGEEEPCRFGKNLRWQLYSPHPPSCLWQFCDHRGSASCPLLPPLPCACNSKEMKSPLVGSTLPQPQPVVISDIRGLFWPRPRGREAPLGGFAPTWGQPGWEGLLAMGPMECSETLYLQGATPPLGRWSQNVPAIACPHPDSSA